MMRTPLPTCLAALLVCVLSACVRPVQDQTADHAGCETPTEANLIPEARMLPGRVCQVCHTSGGEAGHLTWTASGTVYPGPTALCDTGGLDGVLVEILDAKGNTLISLTTNRSGNFYTSEDLGVTQIRARVSKDGKSREMVTVQTTTACATCHLPGGVAGGRMYLD